MIGDSLSRLTEDVESQPSCRRPPAPSSRSGTHRARGRTCPLGRSCRHPRRPKCGRKRPKPLSFFDHDRATSPINTGQRTRMSTPAHQALPGSRLRERRDCWHNLLPRHFRHHVVSEVLDDMMTVTGHCAYEIASGYLQHSWRIDSHSGWYPSLVERWHWRVQAAGVTSARTTWQMPGWGAHPECTALGAGPSMGPVLVATRACFSCSLEQSQEDRSAPL